MNLRQLEILRAIVRYNTTVAAGQALGLSQPAVSNALKAMESQVGFALFERVNNRIFPTAEAKALLDDAEPIFEIHQKLGSRIKDLRDNRAGQLRIAATPPLGYGIITKSIRETQIRRPRVRTVLDVRRYEEVIRIIETHQAELGFVMGFSERPGICFETIFEGEMTCVMQPDHPLADNSVVTPKDLANHPFIALEQYNTLGIALRHIFNLAGVEINAAAEAGTGLTACLMADAGIGATVVDPLTPSSIQGLSLIRRPFLPRMPITASMIWAENRPLTRLAHMFRDEVKRHIGLPPLK